MAGARTEGEKRRRKKASRNQEAWAGAEQRGPGRPKIEGVARLANERISRAAPIPPEKADAARRVVTEARCKAMGWPNGPEWRDLALAEHLGCEAGRAIHDLPSADRAALWEVIKTIRRVYTRYWVVHGLPMPYPDALSLAMLPEQVTSDNLSEAAIYDDRTIEEKSRASTTAMMRLEGVLMTYRVSALVKSVVLRDERPPSISALVLAMLVVAKKIDGEDFR